MERYDVVVMGLDPALPREQVVVAVASHLSTSAAEIERLLFAAPSVLIEGVSELDARRLVTDLRKLGARVKPRVEGQAMPSSPPPASASVSPLRPPSLPPLEPPRSSPPSSRSPLEAIDVSALPKGTASGLELDLPLPAPRTPSVAPRPVSVAPRAPSVVAREPVVEPRPSARPPPSIDVREDTERPRAFWTALPEAFVVPFRGHAIYGLLGAPVLAVLAMVVAVYGIRMSFYAALMSLVLVFAFVGTILQLGRRCLWATAVGERVPDPLSSDYMSDYMFTGAAVTLSQGALAAGSTWLSNQMVGHGAAPWMLYAFWLFGSLYGVIGFALSAANSSASGYFDVARILRILMKAPIHVLTIANAGAVVQGGALFAAGLQLVAATATGDDGAIFVSVGIVGFLLAFAATYGAALTATMMGMLFHAKPSVAS
jgi:hypothetical protein